MNIQGNAEAMQKPGPVEHPQRDHSTGFDYRVHVKDAKTGRLIRTQHYARHSREGTVLLERPIGSGNCFHENGESAGRWKFTLEGNEVKWEKLSDKHIDVKASAANREEELEIENDLLQQELEALRAEAGKQAAGQRKKD